MLTIGFINSSRNAMDREPPPQGRDWRLISIPTKRALGVPFEQVIARSRLNAVAIIGLGYQKTRCAEKSLLSGKHVLVDFPLSHDFKEASRLRKIAEERDLCLYSPNLLRTEYSIQEVMRLANLSAKILSLTITCGTNTRFELSECTMRLAQLIDLSEWITGSKCSGAKGMRSTNCPSIAAFVIPFSLKSGVNCLVNLYSARSKSSIRLWIDVVFEDSVLHVDPYAQAVRLIRFSDNAGESISWAPSSMSRVLEDFVARIRGGAHSMIPDETERVLNLAHTALDV